MHIKIFMNSAASMWERDVLRAYAHGVEQWAQENSDGNIKNEDSVLIGRWKDWRLTEKDWNGRHFVSYDYSENYSQCDVAVIFGSWKPREKGSHITRNSVVSQAKRFICIETPLLKRTTNGEHEYFRTGLNGFLAKEAWWPEAEYEQSQQRLDQLGITWPGWKNNKDGHVLLALQLPGDASLRGADINDWAYRTVTSLRAMTDKPIVIRNHPLATDRAFEDHHHLAYRLMLDGIQGLRFSDGAQIPWDEDLKDAYCTVTYTSGLAIDSVLAGVPTIACDAGNFAWPFSTRRPMDVNDLEMPGSDVIKEWLRQLMASQYSVKEMQSGLAWTNMLATMNSLDGT